MSSKTKNQKMAKSSRDASHALPFSSSMSSDHARSLRSINGDMHTEYTFRLSSVMSQVKEVKSLLTLFIFDALYYANVHKELVETRSGFEARLSLLKILFGQEISFAGIARNSGGSSSALEMLGVGVQRDSRDSGANPQKICRIETDWRSAVNSNSQACAYSKHQMRAIVEAWRSWRVF